MAQEAITSDGTSEDPAPADPAAAGSAPAEAAAPSRWRPLPWTRMGVALAAGALLYLAFPPVGWWPLAPVAVAAMTVTLRAVRPRHAAAIALMAGIGFYGVLFEWMRPIGADAWMGAALAEALLLVPLGMAVAYVQRLPGWPVWVAGLWVAEELIRARFPFGGFTWGRLAYSQNDSALTSYAAIGGAPLVTFAVALAGALLAAVLVGRGRAVRAGAAAGALAVAGLGLALPRGDTGGQDLTVALVQGSVPNIGSMDFLGDERARVLRNHAGETKKLAARVRRGAAPRPDLVVWPENSSDLDAYRDPVARREIGEAARAIGVPILINSVVETNGGANVRNRGILWHPETGPGDYYDKRRLVPFGESMPFRPLLEALFDRVAMVPRDFVADDRPGVFDLGTVKIGAVTCYEASFDDIPREAVAAGGSVLTVQTNNATYGHTGLPSQQLAMSQLRAVEHNRAVLVPATTGATATIGPDGTIRKTLPLNRPGVLIDRVPARTETTIATTVGEGSEWTLALLGAGALLWAVWRARKGGAAA